jgi:hypothetical protein
MFLGLSTQKQLRIQGCERVLLWSRHARRTRTWLCLAQSEEKKCVSLLLKEQKQDGMQIAISSFRNEADRFAEHLQNVLQEMFDFLPPTRANL